MAPLVAQRGLNLEKGLSWDYPLEMTPDESTPGLSTVAWLGVLTWLLAWFLWGKKGHLKRGIVTPTSGGIPWSPD